MNHRIVPAGRRLPLASAAAFAVAASSPALAASTFGPGVSQGVVNTVQIDEASGLVASRNNANVVWTHNDSGDTNRIFALDTTGKLLGTYTLSGAANADWEEISVGPGPVAGVNYLYLMESNSSSDPGRIYRVPEPVVYASQALSPVSKTVVGVESKKFSFPVPDSEAMFVDPIDGNIYLGSKESGATKFYQGTQAQFSAAGTTTLSTVVATVPLSKGNAASISPNGREILVRNGGQFALLYKRSATQTVAQALANPSPDFIGVNGQDIEPNAEAIAFDGVGNNFFTVSEGVSPPLYRYTRTSGDAPFAPATLVAAGAQWKYRDNGSDQGTPWRAAGFDDSSWSSGSTQLGYGDSDEATVVSFGGNAANKFVTTYFRKTFTVADAAAIQGLTLKLLYDDGAAVYLNGVEIARENLLPGAAFNTLANGATPDALENTWVSLGVSPALLVNGLNTLSIEIHQSALNDPDISFDAQLLTAVPEPAAGMLLLLSAPLLHRRRRAIR